MESHAHSRSSGFLFLTSLGMGVGHDSSLGMKLYLEHQGGQALKKHCKVMQYICDLI